MRLLEPISIGTMTLRNRMVMPAVGTLLFTPDGLVSERAVAWLVRRAAGGVGMVTLESTGIHRGGVALQRPCLIDRDECIEGLSLLAQGVHSHGAKLAVPLWHAGHLANPAVTGEQPVAPSPVPAPGRSDFPRQLAVDEIEELVGLYGEGARRAREAGADAVEIHGSQGYLIAQFLSPLLNKRTDGYGGDLRGRARFALEVVSRVRHRVGPDFPVLFKVSAQEHVEGGGTLEDTKALAGWLEEAGVDGIIVASGSRFAPHWAVQPMMFPRGCLVPFAAAVKSVVGVPVGAMGRINDPLVAEKALADGQADFVNLGRALIADPDFPRKVQEGRIDEIRMCTACCLCIDTIQVQRQPIQCMVNPEAGRELEWKQGKAVQPKRVLVVGAGPGGLEAACVAGQRGHDVTICDRAEAIGGMVALGCKPPSKAELKTLLDYYGGELKRTNVDVRLGQRVTAEWVKEMAPDVVIAAIGSVPLVPKIPGVEQGNVVQARDVLADEVALARSAVVIGGGSVGCEVAEYLRFKGLDVTVVEMLNDFALDMEGRTRTVFLAQLRSANVGMLCNARIVRIEGRLVEYLNAGGEIRSVEGDTIVLAVGACPETELVDALKTHGIPVVPVGDCIEPRRIHNAVYEGALAGQRV